MVDFRELDISNMSINLLRFLVILVCIVVKWFCYICFFICFLIIKF